MAAWLGSRAASSTVACITLTGTGVIVDPDTAQEGCSGVTGAAIPRGFKVGRVGLCTLTDCCITIMA